MFTHRRSVALIALNHWLQSWPTNQEEADQANKAVKVAGWKWVHCLQSKGFKQWEFEHCTEGDTQYITRLDWRPVKFFHKG